MTVAEAPPISVPFVVAGQLVTGAVVEHISRDLGATLVMPALDLDRLVLPKHTPGPAFDVPTAEIVDFLVETGRRLRLETNAHLRDALDQMTRVNPLGPRILATCYAELSPYFERDLLNFQIEREIGGADLLDGWRDVVEPNGRRSAVRAFPLRLAHILAGNGPGVAAMSIVRGALTKGVHLFKLPSNDLFTATAILRTMAEIDPDHPTVRSFSAVYWRGGDRGVESVLYRPQWFDKLVVWGGESAVRSALNYVGPGFELISFDPKISISLIGREAFTSEATLAEAAELGAHDGAVLNQDACAASRYQFVEGTPDQVDDYCARLTRGMAVDRPLSSGQAGPTPAAVRDEVEILRHLEPAFRVWGEPDGTGLVIRSEEPVDFHPDGKTVNVVPVADLAEAARWVTVATQTVGVYPSTRKAALRDTFVSAGAQRLVPLGDVARMTLGMPHDGMQPLARFVRWASDEGDGRRP